ncbi:T9SS type A sorting domain-containing protein [candidate division WOR-3 bacterium]|uniref:T9SS type A sorting domain-containing protein n=1 Tax=candidate division WOR-3 bacterium TaxID=2052148 RepID=A0A937XGR9_UNCW3|nr:T9SS type A sorting domain-containing protein [candidate division WOR-3 bacterium]
MEAYCYVGNSRTSTCRTKVVVKIVKYYPRMLVYQRAEEYPSAPRSWGLFTVVPGFSLPDLTGRFELSLELRDLETLVLLDSSSVCFDVAHEPRGGGQGYDTDLTDGCDQSQLKLSPVGRATLVTYSIPKPLDVSIIVRDVAGRAVRTLLDASQAAGQHRLTWDGTADGGRILPSGTYFCTMNSGDFTVTRKTVKAN